MKKLFLFQAILFSAAICFSQNFSVGHVTIDSTPSYYTGSYSNFYEYAENMTCVDSNAKISLLSIENYELQLYESVDTGATWSKTKLSPGDDGDYYSALMLCTDEGKRVIIYGVNTYINYGQSISTWDCFKYGTYAYVETGSGWQKTTLSPPSTVSNYGLLPYGIYRHSNGQIHAFLHHYGWNNYGGKLYECIYDPVTNVWTSPVNIMNATYSYIDRATVYYARIAEDPNGNLSLMFRRQKNSSNPNESELTSLTQVGHLWTGVSPVAISPTYNGTYWNWDIARDVSGHFYLAYTTPHGPSGPELILCRDGLTGDTLTPFSSSDTLLAISFIEFAMGEPIFQCYFKYDTGRKLFQYDGQGNFYPLPDPLYDQAGDSAAWFGYNWILWPMQQRNNIGLKDHAFLMIKESQGRDPVTNAVLPMPISWFRMDPVVYSQEAELISFSIPNMLSSTIDTVNKEVVVVMPVGTNFSALTPDVVEVSPYATVYPPAGMTMDFTSPVTYTVTAQDTSVKEDYEVTVTDLTGLEEPGVDAVVIYPNPTEHLLFIRSEQAVRLELFTLDGRLLQEVRNVQDFILDMTACPNGIYLLRLSDDTSCIVKKVLRR